MRNFENWLRSRDSSLMEVLDQEHLQAHDFDALGAAQNKIKEKKEKEENEKAIDNLEYIKDNLEKWVGHDEHGAEKLKWLAAVMKLEGPKDGSSNSSGHSSIHHYKNTFKNIEGLNNMFKKENIISHLGDPQVIYNIRKQLETNWEEIAHDIHQDSNEVERGHDHTHGELGKHFSEFVVSTIIHVVDTLLKGLKGEKEEPENQETLPLEEPENQENPPTEEPETPSIEEPETDSNLAEPLGSTQGTQQAKS